MIRVKIPATTANIGPGFDCMGLSLDLWNTFEMWIEPDLKGASVESQGEGAHLLPRGKDNLILSIISTQLRQQNIPMPDGLRIRATNGIPCASGLGSSSTAVLAGLLFAEKLRLRYEGTYDTESINMNMVLEQAVEIEGHGDNVAPALLGGLIVVVPTPDGVITRRLDPPNMRVTVCVPDYCYLTSEARAALPAKIPREDAIFNVGRAMLVLEALRDNDDHLLARSLDDRIHEQYRLPQIPGALKAKEAALASNALAVGLSGAGPGLIAFASSSHEAIGQEMVKAFKSSGTTARYWVLDADMKGTQIESFD